MSENEFWVRPKSLPPFIAPVRGPVVLYETGREVPGQYTLGLVTLTDEEITDYKQVIENELGERNPDLSNKRAACLLDAKNTKVFSEIYSAFTVIAVVLTTIYHLVKLFYYRLITTDDISLFQIIEYLIKTSPLTYVSILLFFLILFSIDLIQNIEKDKAQKELRELEKEVQDFIDSEYRNAYAELITKKTSRLNGELSRKEFIQATAAFTKAENAHRKVCDEITEKCDNLCKEAVSIYKKYIKKIANIEDILRRLDLAIKEVEQTFSDSRYAPFWKAVEECFSLLAECDKNLKQFRGLQVDRYYTIRNDDSTINNLLHLPVPTFDIRAPQRVLATLSALIRKSESIIEFATIHQMIETRRDIVNGFENLHDAVEDVGWNIRQTIMSTSLYLSSELASLGRNIEYSLEAATNRISSSIVDANEANIQAIELLNESVAEVSSGMLEIAEQSESSREEEFERLQEVAERQTDALDDIRRGRIPTGPDPRKAITKPK